MFGKANILNSNVWNRLDPQFQCLEKPKSSIPMLEKTRSSISMSGKAQILNSNDWKSQSPQFQCLEKTRSSIPMFGKAQILNSNVWKRLDSYSNDRKSTK